MRTKRETYVPGRHRANLAEADLGHHAGTLIVGAPLGFAKAGDRLGKDPGHRARAAMRLVFDQVAELGSARPSNVKRHCRLSRAATSSAPAA